MFAVLNQALGVSGDGWSGKRQETEDQRRETRADGGYFIFLLKAHRKSGDPGETGV